MSDYEQWKEWLDKWNVEYTEETWNPGLKELIIRGSYCVASIQFDLNEKYLELTAYE